MFYITNLGRAETEKSNRRRDHEKCRRNAIFCWL